MAKQPTKAKKQTHGTKRAAIYVRVSTEEQAGADKASPETQERDARDLCKRQGYIVAEVYRDIEKYRINGRLVEPSGTRNDRPQLKRMLADADTGLFDVIIAWREDRLYRGVNRAMLEISERVKSKTVEVELVKEHYDPDTAAVKAWAAGVELKARHDRIAMGFAKRLKSGKALNGIPPYGFRKVDGRYLVNPDEAQWVKLIWQWYAEDVPTREIQRRLVSAGAKQRGGRHLWGTPNIRGLLRTDFYYTGKQTITWDGQPYEITMPVLIDRKTAELVTKRQARFKDYPAGHLKDHTLAAGRVYCKVCGVRLTPSYDYGPKRVDGTRRKFIRYACNNHKAGVKIEGCIHKALAHAIDDRVWTKVWAAISVPGKLDAMIQAEIERLQSQQSDADADVEKYTRQLDDLLIERQKIITWGRKGIISEADMATQLTGLDWQQAAIQGEINKAQLLSGNRASRLIAIADKLQREVEIGRELLALPERTPEQEADVFRFKRTVIQGLVKRADVAEDKSVEVQIEITIDGDGADHADGIVIADGLAHQTVRDHYTLILTL